MSLESAYAMVGGNIDEVRGRFRDDARILKYMKMFLADSTFSDLEEACERGDIASAFRYAHTLKGTSKDMALGNLAEAASVLSDIFRPNAQGEYPTLERLEWQLALDNVRNEYMQVITAFVAEGLI
jgi:chemotaxis protein histidine kinase CheA